MTQFVLVFVAIGISVNLGLGACARQSEWADAGEQSTDAANQAIGHDATVSDGTNTDHLNLDAQPNDRNALTDDLGQNPSDANDLLPDTSTAPDQAMIDRTNWPCTTDLDGDGFGPGDDCVDRDPRPTTGSFFPARLNSVTMSITTATGWSTRT